MIFNVLLTGATKGIGLAISQQLLTHQNVNLVGTTREVNELPGFLRNQSNFIVETLDLQDIVINPSRIKELVNQYPATNCLILNAGYGQFGHLEQFSDAQIIQMLSINLTSQLIIIKAFLPLFKKQKYSRVIVIGSENAHQGGPYGAVYSACKAGLKGAIQSLRKECAKNNIHFGMINPGMVNTSFFDHLDFQPGQDPNNSINPNDIAKAVELMMLMPDNCVVDEINLSPLKKVVNKKLT